MEKVFLQLVNISITASYLVLAVVVLRPLLKRAPKWIRGILWALAGLRLVLPFSWESVFSLIPSREPIPQQILYDAVPQINTGIPVVNSVVNPILAETMTPFPGASANPIQILVIIAANIWVVGMACMSVYGCISYLLLRRRLREAVHTQDRVWICDRIDSPFLLGLFRPRIYLPSSLASEDAAYVIAHEKAHLQRKDHLWKPLGFLILMVYWFNPLIWLAYVLLCRDIELACDEKVIRLMGEGSKKAYSNALIRCSVPRRSIAACPVAFGEGSIKGRIRSVLSYKKPSFWIIVAALVICVAVAVCFLTVPEDPADDQCTSFRATVLEIQENGILLAPEEGSSEAMSSDRFFISMVPDGVLEGYSVIISYDGQIEELYPAQIPNVYQIQILGDPAQEQALMELRKEYPQFFDLPVKNGLTVHVWAFARGAYKCSVMPGQNPELSLEEMMELEGIDLSNMQKILRSYGLSRDEISVVLVQHPLSSYAFINTEIPDHQAYILWALGLSDGPKPEMPNSGGTLMFFDLPEYDRVTFDVDNDGVEEECKLLHGPTSGIFTFQISVSKDGNIEYYGIYTARWTVLSFEIGTDGKLYLLASLQEGDPTPIKYTVTVDNTGLVLESDGERITETGKEGDRWPHIEPLPGQPMIYPIQKILLEEELDELKKEAEDAKIPIPE